LTIYFIFALLLSILYWFYKNKHNVKSPNVQTQNHKWNNVYLAKTHFVTSQFGRDLVVTGRRCSHEYLCTHSILRKQPQIIIVVLRFWQLFSIVNIRNYTVCNIAFIFHKNDVKNKIVNRVASIYYFFHIDFMQAFRFCLQHMSCSTNCKNIKKSKVTTLLWCL
jgi:hypothetical protein